MIQVRYIETDLLLPMEDIRFHRDEMKDNELFKSIQEWGVRDALLARPHPDDGLREQGKIEVIDGRRRLRLGHEAGLTTLPVDLRDMGDEEAYAMALVKNLQRAHVDDVGLGHWLELMQIKFGWSQEKLAMKMGKSQSWVSRLMNLWKQVSSLENKQKVPISERQSRAIRTMPPEQRERILQRSKQMGLVPHSARELERIARAKRTPQEVLEKMRKNLADEFVALTLAEEAGMPMSDAMSMVSRWKLGSLPWQTERRKPLGDYEPDARNKQVQLYKDLSRYFPVELIDAVDAVAPSRTLETAIRNCRRFVAKLFNKASLELRQAVLEEFKL